MDWSQSPWIISRVQTAISQCHPPQSPYPQPRHRILLRMLRAHHDLGSHAKKLISHPAIMILPLKMNGYTET
eukprot:363418-Chlamydomonas_euryale.AAC.3